MTKPIQLDLRRDLPKVRAALDELRTTRGKCQYSSPCAIGTMLSAEDRAQFRGQTDDSEGVDALLGVAVFSCPAGQRDDLLLLQEVFDDDESDFVNFTDTLTYLEAKYASEQAAS